MNVPKSLARQDFLAEFAGRATKDNHGLPDAHDAGAAQRRGASRAGLAEVFAALKRPGGRRGAKEKP